MGERMDRGIHDYFNELSFSVKIKFNFRQRKSQYYSLYSLFNIQNSHKSSELKGLNKIKQFTQNTAKQ